MWKAFCILAVVIDHVVTPNPLESLFLTGIELLVPPCPFRSRAQRRSARRHARVCAEALVRRHERSLTPISLHEPTPGGPVVSIPQAGVEAHRLVLRVGHSHLLAVPKSSDRCSIHVEAALNQPRNLRHI